MTHGERCWAHVAARRPSKGNGRKKRSGTKQGTEKAVQKLDLKKKKTDKEGKKAHPTGMIRKRVKRGAGFWPQDNGGRKRLTKDQPSPRCKSVPHYERKGTRKHKGFEQKSKTENTPFENIR